MNLENYDIKQATHDLNCRYQIGRNGFNYKMPCVVLWKKGAKAKVIVFGERAWANREHIKHVRYVNRFQLSECAAKTVRAKRPVQQRKVRICRSCAGTGKISVDGYDIQPVCVACHGTGKLQTVA